MGHVRKCGLKGAGVGAMLGVALFGLMMWRLGLWSGFFGGVREGEIGFLRRALPYLAAIGIGTFGVLGGVLGLVIGWCAGPGQDSRHPRKDSLNPLE